MKLSKVLVLSFSAQVLALPTPDETGVLLNHKPGTSDPISNLYMHTIGHVVSDFPQYIGQLASGDVVGTVKNLAQFTLYHNPINLLQDLTAGMLGGGTNSDNDSSGGGHNH